MNRNNSIKLIREVVRRLQTLTPYESGLKVHEWDTLQAGLRELQKIGMPTQVSSPSEMANIIRRSRRRKKS